MKRIEKEIINMLPDHVAGVRLAVMLAARGVTGEGLSALVAEAERIGRMADALVALVAAVGDTRDAVRALVSVADVIADDPDAYDESLLRLEDGLRAAATALTATD